MNHQEIREKFLKFFESKGHKIVPSSSLVPENDPTTLFTSSGMQPLIPYLLGKAHPDGKRITDSQKSFRAEDIEEVGDNRHTTFFEMLGNWSFGDYWKKEQLNWFFEFLTDEIKLDPKRLYVSVFSGGHGVSRDDESISIWKNIFESKGINSKYSELGTLEEAGKKGMQDGERIFGYGAEKNWWSRSGKPDKMPAGEPGGPDSEMFYDFGTEHDSSFGLKCHPNCDCGRFIEIGNSVFMEFRKKEDGGFEPLPQRNVDFGGGLERTAAASENQSDVFLTSAFLPIIKNIELESGKKYGGEETRNFRIIADHIKASIMLINDGVVPSNKLQGYIVRRLIRRAMRYARLLEDTKIVPILSTAGKVVIDMYSLEDEQIIMKILSDELLRFSKTLASGLKEIEKIDQLNAKNAFSLYETFGYPFEMTEEIARERGQKVEYGDFKKEFEAHQEKSRAGAEKKFGGHGLLLDTGELKAGNEEELKKATRLHTATHLLHASLRKVLGNEVHQAGSDITAERLRFDFNFSRKLTAEELQKIEDLANEAVRKDYQVTKVEMTYEDAIKSGALAFFKLKYPTRVNVYSVGEFSKELCGGPHVSHTAEIGKIKISKEEAVSAGVRRIRAVVLDNN